MNNTKGYKLIVTIVEKGNAEDVVDFTKQAGAEGGTILMGRGIGIHETTKIFGIPIEPEKEIILTLIPADKSEKVLEAINNGMNLEKPGSGIAFAIDLEKVIGICHGIKQD